MKNTLPALGLLTAILGLCIWSDRTIERDNGSRQAELQQVESLVQAEQWEEARHTLLESYQRWSQQTRYLRILSTHSMIDEADGLYHQIMASVSIQEQNQLIVDLVALRHQLTLLTLREQPTLGSIL